MEDQLLHVSAVMFHWHEHLESPRGSEGALRQESRRAKEESERAKAQPVAISSALQAFGSWYLGS